MAPNKAAETFSSWRKKVDNLVARRFDATLAELEEDVSASHLREAFEDGLTPEMFIREEIAPLFEDYDDEEADEDEEYEGDEDDDRYVEEEYDEDLEKRD